MGFLKGDFDSNDLYGESGDDTLRGDSANDNLDGGTGNDDCDGGSGGDDSILNCGSSGGGIDLPVDNCQEEQIAGVEPSENCPA